MLNYIFHIVPGETWDKSQKKGVYKPLSLKEDGFIHCSKADQTLEVAEMFFNV